MSKYKFKGPNKDTKRKWTFHDCFHPKVTTRSEPRNEPKYATLCEAYEARFKPWKHKKPFKLNKKKLLGYEVQEYKRIGKPDANQNYLELFTPEIVNDLFTILNFGSDNYEKANHVIKELKDFGFKALGEGTNILVMVNAYYPGVVFKIALDSNGVADNFNDEILQQDIPRYAKVYARHSSGIVSVQERYVVMRSDRMKDFTPRVLWLLEKLSQKYLVADLSPSRFLNFGVGRDGDFVIIDGSDLYPLKMMDTDVRCQKEVGWDNKKRKVIKCGGHLTYTYDYLNLVCKKCGRAINPLELRPHTKEVESQMSQFTSNGTTPEQRELWEKEELEAIRKRTGVQDPVAVEKRDEEPESVDTEVIGTGAAEEVETDEPVMEQGDFDQEEPAVQDEGVEETTSEQPDTEGPIRLTHKNQDTDIPEDIDEDEGDIEEPRPADPVEYPHEDTNKAEPEDSVLMGTIDDGTDDEEEEDEGEGILSESADSEDQAESAAGDNHVDFKVIPANDDQSNESIVGIYIDITGDFDEAWEAYGLPIFVQLDSSGYQRVMGVDTFKSILARVVDEIKEEQAEIAANKMSSDDSDDEDEETEGDDE